MFNQAFFEKLLVEHDEVKGSVLAQPFAGLLAHDLVRLGKGQAFARGFMREMALVGSPGQSSKTAPLVYQGTGSNKPVWVLPTGQYPKNPPRLKAEPFELAPRHRKLRRIRCEGS